MEAPALTFSADPPALGQRYILHAPLGVGSMGIVYTATDRLTGATVALKRLSAAGERWRGDSTATDGTQPRVLLANEFQTLASLRHPNIISVLDYGFDAERNPFIIEELLPDPLSIRDAAVGKPLAAQVDLLLQVLRALAYMHRRGIIHRDLKPSNILVVGAQVKVLDFGLAILRADAHKLDDSVSGTLAYIAPEILVGAPPGELSDLYAVGVIAYELLAGRHPFPADNAGVLVQDILAGEVDFSPLAVDDALAGVIARLMARVPEQRYASADEAMAALAAAIGLPLPDETPAIRDSFLQAAHFVGRERELRQLTVALEAALAGHGSTWLVAGESGVGKSRLITELRTRALVKGARGLHGQGVSEGRVAYGMWRDSLRSLAVLAEPDTLDLSVLKRVAPELPALLGRPLPDAPDLDATATQTRLFAAVGSALRRLGQPVVIVLEDLHWAGDEDLVLLRWLCNQAAQLPLLIVASYRDDERPDLPERLPEANVLHLDRLSEPAIAALSASMLGNAGRDPSVVSLLQRETEGNVYFLVEIVRALAEDAGRLAHVGQKTLPLQVFSGGIQEVVRRRLGRLPGAAHSLLRLAAVIGRQIDLSLLRRVVDDVYLNEWLMTCANGGVLSVQDGVWRFDHDKLREGVLAELNDDARRSLHAQAGALIEQVYVEDVRQATALAYHWCVAGRPDREQPHSARAGFQALELSAFAEAVHYLDRALALTPPDADFDRTLVMRQGLADAYAGLSQLDRAHELYAQNLADWRATGDQRGIARALRGLGGVAEARGEYAAAETYFAESLTICRAIGYPSGAARVLEGLSNAAFRLGNYAQALSLIEDALAVNRAIDHTVGLANSLKLLGSIRAARGDYAGAQDSYQQSLALYRRIGQKQGISACLNNLGLIAATMGDFEQAKAYSYDSLDIKAEIGDRRGRASTLNNLGIVTHQLGEYEESRRVLEECLSLSRAIGDRQAIADASLNLGRAWFGLGDTAQAERLFAESRDQFEALSDPWGVSVALLNLGRAARARQAGAEAYDWFLRGLKVAVEIDKTQTQGALLVELALLLVERRDYEAAVSVLSVTRAHPAIDHDYRVQAESLLATIQEMLTVEAYTAAEGRFASLEDAVAAVLAGRIG